MNLTIQTGQLTRAPETRTTKDGTTVSNFRLAVENEVPHKNGDGQDAEAFVNVVTFGKLADAVDQYLGKGWRVLVRGRLRGHDWTDKAGTTRHDLDVYANRVEFLAAPKGSTASDVPEAAEADDNETS